MFLVSGKDGPIACFKDESKARTWADKFGWTMQAVEDGDIREPISLVTGYMNLLDPNKKPVFQDRVVSFDHSRKSFPDANTVKEGDLYFRANLENYFFCVEHDFDVVNGAIKFWQELRGKGLDLQRQISGQFKIIRVSPGTVIESEVNLSGTSSKVNPTVPEKHNQTKVVTNPVALPGGSGRPPETI